MQADDVTLLDIENETMLVKTNLSKLEELPLLGGWVSVFELQLESQKKYRGKCLIYSESNEINNDGQMCRRGHHLYVSDKRDLCSVEHELTESLIEFSRQSFSTAQKLMKYAEDMLS